MLTPALEIKSISKRFGALVANDNISLSLAPGEVLGLLGENGAGKSTLVSILFGHYLADSGSIDVFGQPLPAGDPKAALAAGIGMVHQHFTLADNLSVLDNIMLGSEPLWQVFSRRSAGRAKLLDVANKFGLEVQPDALVGSLSVGERQRVEIVKALFRGAKILILDEPTAVLTPQESLGLFATLDKLVALGLSVIFISHKLPEVLRVCHRVAVLRAGRLVATLDAATTTEAQLAQAMVGQTVKSLVVNRAEKVGATVCELSAVSAGPPGRNRMSNVTLSLRAGEIVAIAGVSGNGQGALADLLCGVLRASGGRITLQGKPWPAGSTAALSEQGVARIPEDRRAVGLIGSLPLWENAVAERLRSPSFSKFGFVWRDAAKAYAARIVQQFDVRGSGLQSACQLLSGGNMQKLILGRALMPPDVSPDGQTTPQLIVAHQPTWGLDIGAVSYVHQQLLAARDAGAAVLLISDDLDEVMALGDRIAVMHAGELTPALSSAAWTRDRLGLAMAGSVAKAEVEVAVEAVLA